MQAASSKNRQSSSRQKYRTASSKRRQSSPTKGNEKSPCKQKHQAVSSNGRLFSTTKGNEKSSCRRKHWAASSKRRQSSTTAGNKKSLRRQKCQAASSKSRQSSTTKGNMSPRRQKYMPKRRFPCSNDDDEQSTSTKNYKVKRLETKIDKIYKRRDKPSRKQRQGQLDFSIYIPTILKELHPDHTIAEKVEAKIDTYLNCIFEHLVTTSATVCRGIRMTVDDIEAAVLQVLGDGVLSKNCVAEGRKAVENMKSVQAA